MISEVFSVDAMSVHDERSRATRYICDKIDALAGPGCVETLNSPYGRDAGRASSGFHVPGGAVFADPSTASVPFALPTGMVVRVIDDWSTDWARV